VFAGVAGDDVAGGNVVKGWGEQSSTPLAQMWALARALSGGSGGRAVVVVV